ncbi:MAG: hypothetical protein AAB264_04465 [Planctomycetota bacterium]
MQIRCNHCGHNFEMDEAYDNYEGEVKCWVCGAILEVKMHDGYLISSRNARTAIPVTKIVKQQRSLA